MELRERQFQQFLEAEKGIYIEIEWRYSSENRKFFAFEAALDVPADLEIEATVHGSYSPVSLPSKLSFNLVIEGVGEVYCLCMNHRHNWSESPENRCHKHSWHLDTEMKQVYVPDDISSPFSRVRETWQEFCAEANIRHTETLEEPPSSTQSVIHTLPDTS